MGKSGCSVYTIPVREQLDRWNRLGRDLFEALNEPDTLDVNAFKLRIAVLLANARPCEICSEPFMPSHGEYHRCPRCLAAAHRAAELATGVS